MLLWPRCIKRRTAARHSARRPLQRRPERSSAPCPPQDAKKYCDAEKTCQGFTFKETDEPTQKLSVRFKSNAAVTYDSSWLSYTKSATPTPYFYQAGFLGDGKELHAAQMTLAEAQVRPLCAAQRACRALLLGSTVAPSCFATCAPASSACHLS